MSDESAKQEKPIRRVMAGMRSTGRLHIGHYFGALKNWVSLQDQYQCFFGAMDWHAMTTSYKSSNELRELAYDNVAEWLAWGLDPDKSTIFIQSQVPEHIELFMYFAMITPMGWLERVPTWKDAEEDAKQSDTHNLGRFSYPVLQAADIAIYRGEGVPVGQDQVAHLEISREIIRRMNHLYKVKLPEPKPLLTEIPLLTGTDGRKMSNSYNNVFYLIQEEKELKKSVNKMVTDPKRVRREDPGDPDVCPVFEFHKLFSTEEDRKWVREGCTTAGIGCGDCKSRLFDNLNQFMGSAREKKKELLKDRERLDSILAKGCQKAREEASQTLKRVKDKTRF